MQDPLALDTVSLIFAKEPILGVGIGARGSTAPFFRCFLKGQKGFWT
jgi:hypothetical protein